MKQTFLDKVNHVDAETHKKILSLLFEHDQVNEENFLDYFIRGDDNFYLRKENLSNYFSNPQFSLEIENIVFFTNHIGICPIAEKNDLIIEDISEGLSNFTKGGLLDDFRCISFAMYGECEGDAMREPEFVFAINQQMAIPLYMRVDWLLSPKNGSNYENAPLAYWEDVRTLDLTDTKVIEEQKLITEFANRFFKYFA